MREKMQNSFTTPPLLQLHIRYATQVDARNQLKIVLEWPQTKDSNWTSCNEQAMFCSTIAYTPHIRQNHSTSLRTSTEMKKKKKMKISKFKTVAQYYDQIF